MSIELAKDTNQSEIKVRVAPKKAEPSSEFLAQLAQFRTQDPPKKVQDSLQQFTSSLKSKQALQASALVGRRVFVQSNVLQLTKEGSARLALDLPLDTHYCHIAIMAAKGEPVSAIECCPLTAGFFELDWDGLDEHNQRLAAGSYKVEVQLGCGESKLAAKPMMLANVDSVSLGQNGEGLKLHLAGRGAVSLQEIKKISS